MNKFVVSTVRRGTQLTCMILLNSSSFLFKKCDAAADADWESQKQPSYETVKNKRAQCFSVLHCLQFRLKTVSGKNYFIESFIYTLRTRDSMLFPPRSSSNRGKTPDRITTLCALLLNYNHVKKKKRKKEKTYRVWRLQVKIKMYMSYATLLLFYC